MKTPHRHPMRWLALALSAALFLPSAASPQADPGDTILFTTTAVAPNVLLLLDSSASMNHLIWHPAFVDPAAPVSCSSSTYGTWAEGVDSDGAFDPSKTYYGRNNKFFYIDAAGDLDEDNGQGLTRTHCGNTRTIPADNNASPDPTLDPNTAYTHYSGAYLNWLFSDESDAYWGAGAPAGLRIDSGSNGVPTSCVGGSAYGKYQRTRMNVVKQVVKDIVCTANEVLDVRFGIAQFRNRANGTDDTNGGYVIEELQIPNSTQFADLVSAINSVNADSDGPLAEAVFQLYTYFMSRDDADLPVGKDGSTKFPRYEYNTSSSGTGGNAAGSNGWTADPIQYSCQKNFIMIVTDGDSTKDDFDNGPDAAEAAGFNDFVNKLIGDYNTQDLPPDTEEQPNLVYPGSESTFYLDDIALYMTTNDFRPDFDDDQTIDTYAIGFHASDSANALLEKTADWGNGMFLPVNNEEALHAAIIDQLQNIIEKSQSFTAATVPASRTADGEQLYVSLFTPTSKTAYWDGHLRSYRLDGAGRILDSNGNCALDDPSGDCFSGAFLPTDTAPPYWDASTSMPAPGTRKLFASVLRPAGTDVVRFRHEAPSGGVPPADGVAAADLGVTFPPVIPPLNSSAADAEELTDEIVASVRGCRFGTGDSVGSPPEPCIERAGQLPDIFHSNPVVVGQPALFEADPSYQTGFKGLVGGRDRVIYAGSNGGFLHGVHAGTWQPSATPPAYDEGTGEELFAYMPWTARQNIRHKPFDSGARDYYFVDGSPTVSDAWFYTDWQVGSKDISGTEWHTVLVTGQRQGGEAYLAMDVSDPAACANASSGANFPCYLWEFPREDDVSPAQDYMASTWGDPIITKIRVTDGNEVFERWVAVVTAGYSATSDPNHPSYDSTSLAGRGIAVLDLKTGELLAERHFDPAGDCANPGSVVNNTPEKKMCFAISSSPAVYDADGDGFADLLYVGDLGGNMWKWVLKEPLELSDATTASDPDTDWPFRKFFSAPVYSSGGSTKYKSIYFPPAGTRKNGKIWIAFGTGERHNLLYMSDPATTDDNNRFYVIEETDLWEQAATPNPDLVESDLANLTSTSTCGDLAGKRGYFIVGAEGEKWVTNVDIFVGYVIVNSYIPQPAVDLCDIGGLAFLWAFKVECGEGLFTDASGNPDRTLDLGAGLPTDPRVTVGADGDSSNRLIISKQGGDIINIDAPPGFPGSGIFYWRELID